MRLLTELSSRKFVCILAGNLAKSKVSRHWIRKFASIYGIRLEDAEKPIEAYLSLNDFFTRKLKPGLRPIDHTPHTAISPVDALITGLGPVRDSRLINVKGQDYTVEELLHHSPRAESYKQGYYIILYLSPSDYHRIHSPIIGHIVEKEHIPGRVYPVNDFGLRHMRKVLSRNERLITYIQHEAGELAVVKVGAMNVSSIRYAEALTPDLEKGQELARFEFGSTVVLLFEDNTFTLDSELGIGSQVRMGEALGTMQKAKQ